MSNRPDNDLFESGYFDAWDNSSVPREEFRIGDKAGLIDRKSGKPLYFINTGELMVAFKPVILKTILGSCVGVILWDPVLKHGGMCHYLLPIAPKDELSVKYGDMAIPTLYNKMLEGGSKKDNLFAYVYGGALILDQNEIFFVGDRNILIAIKCLNYYGIRTGEFETGGERGRMVELDTGTGTVKVRFIQNSQVSSIP